MRKLVSILMPIGLAAATMAQAHAAAGCAATATEKKLTGAARDAFVQQCELKATKSHMSVAAKDVKKELAISAGKSGNCMHSASDL